MNNNDNYEFGKTIGNNSVSDSYSGIGTGSGYMIFVIGFFIVLIIVAVIAFFDDDTKVEKTDNSQKATQISEQKRKSVSLVEGKEIEITENYSFNVPKGSEKTEKRLGEGYLNERNYDFVEDNGNYVFITSFCIEDEPGCFPELAEYLIHQGDRDAEIGYSTFGDTAMATSHAEGTDQYNEKLYITSYWWPDGGDTLCCVEIASYYKKSEIPDFVRGTIKGSNSTTDGSESYVPPGAEEALYPDYDEIMMDEVYDYYNEQQRDYYEENRAYPW